MKARFTLLFCLGVGVFRFDAVSGKAAPAIALSEAEESAALLDRLGKRPIRIHDPSRIIKCGNTYWIYGTGPGIRSFHSKDLVNWESGPRIFEKSPPWVVETVPDNRNGLDFWAPDVIRVRNRYFLFYSVSTFGKNTSAIGLASNVTLDPSEARYVWKDEGIVVRSRPEDNFNALDPAPVLDEKGALWLTFGSYWSGIKLVQLDPKTGKRLAARKSAIGALSPEAPLHSLAYHDSIEAAYIHFHRGYYYLFVNWDTCCRGVDSTYNIRIGRSRHITGPYVGKKGRDLATGGGSLFLSTNGPFIGPGHAGIVKKNGRDLFSCHFYDATNKGTPTLAIGALKWEKDGWPAFAPNN